MNITFNPSISIRDYERPWSYLGKVAILARHMMNAFAKEHPQVKAIVTPMKLLSIVSVPFTLLNIKSVAKGLFKSIQLGDAEGAYMSTLSLTIMAADIIDSAATFTNTTLTLASQRTIQILSTIGLPLAASITTLGTVSRTIKITKSFFLYLEIANLNSPEEVKRFLDKRFQSAHDIGRANAKKQNELLRAAPQEALAELRKLYSLLKKPEERCMPEITKSIDRVQDILIKKMQIELLGILANIVVMSALTLFALATGGSLPFFLLATGFSIRIAAQFYQDYTPKKETI